MILSNSDLKKVTYWIEKNDFKRIALQFPPEFISLAPKISKSIEIAISGKRCVFILGDTAYGSCCVDEVGAEHYGADCVIHFGYCCGSPPQRLPTFCLYWADSEKIPTAYINELASSVQNDLLVVCDPHFADLELSTVAGLYAAGLRGGRIILAETVREMIPGKIPRVKLFGRKLSTFVSSNVGIIKRMDLKDFDKSKMTTVFIGDRNSPLFARLLLECPDGSLLCLSRGESGWLKPEKTSNFQVTMRRYAGVEAVKRAERIGVLYGSSALEGVREARDGLAIGLRNVGKQVHGFCVGKLTEEKLGNFSEIDCFVILACGDFLNSQIISNKFHCPIVSAYEAALALGLHEWDGTITTDLNKINWNLQEKSNESENFADFLKSLIPVNTRGYSGLDKNITTNVAKIEPGLSGIPARYNSEGK